MIIGHLNYDIMWLRHIAHERNYPGVLAVHLSTKSNTIRTHICPCKIRTITQHSRYRHYPSSALADHFFFSSFLSFLRHILYTLRTY